MTTLLRKIRARIVMPDGQLVKVNVNPGADFMKGGKRYVAPGPGDTILETLLGFSYFVALYQFGVPKPRPYWIEPSPGLTGDDFENVDGEWLPKKIREALEDKRAQEIKMNVLIGLGFAATGAAGLAAWFAYKVMHFLGA